MPIDAAQRTASRTAHDGGAGLATPSLAVPALSIAVCTHDRAERLVRALGSLIAQTVAPSRLEILVIDNASTDATRSHVDALRARGGSLRYLYEPTLGLTHARNRALHAARSPYLAFLDDDEVADPGWAAQLLAAIDAIRPAPACIGGPIAPLWEAPRPDWLGDALLGYYSVIDLGPELHRLDPTRTPLYGGNFCFARTPLIAVGGFDATLGRRGAHLLSNEDVWAQRRLARAGGTIWYVPGARVRHEVPAARLTPDWVAERAWWQGFSDARMRRLEGGSAGRHAVGATLAWLRSLGAHRELPDAERDLLRRCARRHVAGVLREWGRPRLGAPRSRHPTSGLAEVAPR